MEKVSIRIKGKVQNIMFRQTLIRGLLKRGLEGGATNSKDDKNEVNFSVMGEKTIINELVDKLASGVELNSWGAKVETVHILNDYIEIEAHEVTTYNVDSFNWSPDVSFYL